MKEIRDKYVFLSLALGAVVYGLEGAYTSFFILLMLVILSTMARSGDFKTKTLKISIDSVSYLLGMLIGFIIIYLTR